MTKKEIIKEMLVLNERLLNMCKDDDTIQKDKVEDAIDYVFEYLWDLEEIFEDEE